MLTRDTLRILWEIKRQPKSLVHPVFPGEPDSDEFEYALIGHAYTTEDLLKPLFLVEIIVPAGNIDDLPFKEVWERGQVYINDAVAKRNAEDAARSGSEDRGEVRDEP